MIETAASMLFGHVPTTAGPSIGLRVPSATDVDASKLLFIALIAALQSADVMTTNHVFAVNAAAWELNPIMAWCMSALGSFWWLPKLAVIGFAIAAAPRLPLRGYKIVTFLYVAIVAGNLASF